MKSYIFQRTEKTKNHGGVYHTHYTIRIWQIIRGKPKFVATATDTFCSDFQQFRDVMKANKLWPKKADAVDERGLRKCNYPDDYERAGIMRVTQI